MPDKPDIDYERKDVSPGLLAALAGGLVVTVAALALVLRLAYPQAASDRGQEGAPPAPPEPRLQESPTQDLAEFRRREAERLSVYGWADRGAGTARIPVALALEIAAERGLPGWAKPGQ